jgi:hypothetical protein
MYVFENSTPEKSSDGMWMHMIGRQKIQKSLLKRLSHKPVLEVLFYSMISKKIP